MEEELFTKLGLLGSFFCIFMAFWYAAHAEYGGSREPVRSKRADDLSRRKDSAHGGAKARDRQTPIHYLPAQGREVSVGAQRTPLPMALDEARATKAMHGTRKLRPCRPVRGKAIMLPYEKVA